MKRFALFRCWLLGALLLASLHSSPTLLAQAITITSFTPTSGPPGTYVRVNFNTFGGVNLGSNLASIGNVPAQILNSGGSPAMGVSPVGFAFFAGIVVPANAQTGLIRVTVQKTVAPIADTIIVSATPFTVTPSPFLIGFTPASGPPGTVVTVSGANLNTSLTVALFRGQQVPMTVNAAGTAFTFTVPNGTSVGDASIGYFGPTGTIITPTAFQVTTTPPAPTITSFTPEAGGPGATVLINGIGFTGATAVRFGTLNATSFTVISATQITAVIPLGVTTSPISVVTPSGTGISSTSWISITQTVSRIASLEPPDNLISRSSVTINGSGFTGATQVFMFGQAAQFTVESDTRIRAIVPCGVTDTGRVSIITPSSVLTSGLIRIGGFATPSVLSFSPISGPPGTLVEVRGMNLGCAARIDMRGSVSGIVSAAPTVINDSTLRFTIPNNAVTSTFNVLQVYGGRLLPTGFFSPSSALGSQRPAPQAFTVPPQPPTISGFSPASGAAGSTITITGTNFAGVQSVQLSGMPMQFTVNAAGTNITATVPSGFSNGQQGLISINTQNASVQANSFFIVIIPPFIAGFSPTTVRPKEVVRVFTSPFTLVRSISLNGAQVPLLSYGAGTVAPTNPTGFVAEFRVPIGAQSGTISLVIARTDGNMLNDYTLTTSATLTVLPLQASITNVTPVAGFAGTPITLTGEGFTGATAVSIGGVPVPNYTVNSDESITLTSGNSGGLVQVTTPVGTTSSSISFEVIIPPATITSFSPTSGGPGTVVTITGTNLTGASSVSFGNFATTNVSVNAAGTSLTATVGAEGGTGLLSLLSQGALITSATPFTFVPPMPSIASVSPAQARVGEQTTFTIQGANLLGIASATFGSQNGLVGSNTATQVLVTLTPNTVGMFPISLVAGNNTVSSVGINVLAALPVVVGISPTKARTNDVVTVIGSNFDGATALTLGGSAAQILSNNGSQITARVGSGASGSVAVTTPAGTGSGSAFTFDASAPPPVITALVPTSGAVGTQVKIQGTNLPTNSITVLVGGTVGHTIQSASATEIAFTVGNNAAQGANTIQVFTASVSANSAPLQFTVTPPAALPAPTLVSPTQNAILTSQTGVDASASITLQWNAVQGANQYEAQSASTPDFATPLTSAPTASLTSPRTISRPASGANAQTRYWRVRARNAQTGALSPWSETRTFFVPSLPAMTTVTPGTTKQGAMLTLAVQGSGTNFANASGIQLVFGATTLTGAIAQGATATQLSATFTLPMDAAVGLYDVRVQNAPVTLTKAAAVSVEAASEAVADSTIETDFKVRVHGFAFNNSDIGNFWSPAIRGNLNYSSSAFPSGLRTKFANNEFTTERYAGFWDFIASVDRTGVFGGSVYEDGTRYPGTIEAVAQKYINDWVTGAGSGGAIKALWDGSCAGVVRTSLLNFAGESAYQFASAPYNLPATLTDENIRRIIQRHYAYQEAGRGIGAGTVLEELQFIRSALKSKDRQQHLLISIREKWAGGAGHQVLPYKITTSRNATKQLIDSIYVYDPNHPGSLTQAVVINRNEGKWFYAPMSMGGTNNANNDGSGRFRWVAPANKLAKFTTTPLPAKLAQSNASGDIEAAPSLSFSADFTGSNGAPTTPQVRTVNAGNQAIANFGAESTQPTIAGAEFLTSESGTPPNFRSTISGFALPASSDMAILTTRYTPVSTARRNSVALTQGDSYVAASWLASSLTQAQTIRTNTIQDFILLSSPAALSAVELTNVMRPLPGASGLRSPLNTVLLSNTTLSANDSLSLRLSENGSTPVIEGSGAPRTYTLRLRRGAVSREFTGIGMQANERHTVVVGDWANLSASLVTLITSPRSGAAGGESRVITLGGTSVVGVKNAHGRSATFMIAPNPASEQALLAIPSEASSEAEITVRNVLGASVLVMRASLQSGMNTIPLTTNLLAQGMYIVSVKAGSAQLSSPLVIVR